MKFIRLLLAGYYDPRRFIDGHRSIPAPQWGFYATLIRALMNSLLLYLPLSLNGKAPSMPSFLPFIPTEKYYGALIFITPLVFFSLWLIDSAAIHLCLRLGKRPSDIDQILNITGTTALVVGAFIILWDWSWILLGGMTQYSLGISHLVIDIFWIFLYVTGLKRLLDVPIWLGILLALLTFVIDLPIAYLLMRAPL